MKNSDNKKLSPLEKLRIEKAELKEQCSAKEEEMVSRFSYIYDNLGCIIGNAVLHDITKRMGFAGKRHQPINENATAEQNVQPSSTIRQTVINGLQITYPYFKEFVQPIVIGVVTNKLRNFFRRKDKGKDDKKKR